MAYCIFAALSLATVGSHLAMVSAASTFASQCMNKKRFITVSKSLQSQFCAKETRDSRYGGCCDFNIVPDKTPLNRRAPELCWQTATHAT